MEKFSNIDEVIDERFWRIWRNFESYTEKQISDMTIEEMKEVLEWWNQELVNQGLKI